MGQDPTPTFPIEPLDVSGEEEILPGVRVVNFWAWALGDLRLNSTRGLLAQFLVAQAVGDARRGDDGWGPFDVESDSGIKIEVKSSGYLQSWYQSKLSSISFQGLITKRWDQVKGYTANREVVADVYVFAVHTCTEPAMYDPLNVDYWDFYVMPASTVRRLNQQSMALSTVKRHSGSPVCWSELRRSIEEANVLNSES